ncbi:Monooxygenase, FAD-binding protein [Corchorus olitorius]|uniref:Monooxygenase, FAD-binding protein n=1 Tax=Corchorus olitorius TaxID=93759 RepID=A0A1R3KR65_9ROSI|nr:Monooxygenase, FAD-binding protein [Corchorus olitorius]
MVLERSETLRATGVGIIIQPNGWRALDHLGVASKLRQTSIAVPSKGELRCLKRMDLVEALAEPLPANTVHFGCQVMSIKLDHITSYPILKLQDESVDAPKLFSRCATRGFTWYERGHDFGDKFHIYGKDDVQLGQLPITNNLVYWFLTRTLTSQDSGSSKKDPAFIKETSLEALKGFPEEVMEMIKNSEAKSLYLTELRYHRPWEMVRAEFRRGRVAVAGDAMHTMCPFISQGGGASLEDAVVLARCLSKANDPQNALYLYVKERRMRVFWLSLQTYLIGLTVDSTSKLKKVLGNIILFLIFGGQNSHTDYDCGRL